jgi:ABC-type transport system substrate-binding protein
MDRRSFLARTAAVAAGAAAGAAAGEVLLPGGTAGALTNGPGHNGVSTAKPRRGGSLVFGVDAEEQGFNPTTAKFDNVGVMYARTVFDPLATIDINGNWQPYLARSITPNADYTAWTITLRPNVVFHDGTPCDGAALLMNLEAQYHSLLTGPIIQPVVQTFTQTGPLSVTANLKQAWVPFPYYLAGGQGGQVAYVMAPSMINAKTGGTDHPVGTGPFKFKQWIPNTHFTATAWEGYWRPGLPYLDSVTYKPVPDATSLSDALKSGTVDMMISDTPQTIVLYRGNKQWSYIDDSGHIVGEPTMNCLLLNLSLPPFNDATVRLAAAKAISRVDYSKIVDISVNPPSTGLFVPGSPYYSKTTYPAYDPAGAKELLAKVAHRTGRPVSFTMGEVNDPATVRSGTFLKSELEKVGFEVSIATVEQNKLIDNALQGTFHCYQWRQFGAADPDMNYIFWSTTTYNANGLSVNMARNNDPRVEAALQVGRTSVSESARAKAYQKVNQLFAQDLPYLWNDRAVWAAIAHPSVQNFNNPTTPTGAKAYGMIGGSLWVTQIWKS